MKCSIVYIDMNVYVYEWLGYTGFVLRVYATNIYYQIRTQYRRSNTKPNITTLFPKEDIVQIHVELRQCLTLFALDHVA